MANGMTAAFTVEHGQAAVFVAVDHCSAECVGIHAGSPRTRPEALEPVRQGVAERFGGGRQPAGLNFDDCFACALARETGETLLFKGNGFARTDLTTRSERRPGDAPQ